MKIATLRITIPIDDAIRVEEVVSRLRAAVRDMGIQAVERPAKEGKDKEGQADIEKDVGAIFWPAADVKRGPATKAEKAQSEGAAG